MFISVPDSFLFPWIENRRVGFVCCSWREDSARFGSGSGAAGSRGPGDIDPESVQRPT